MIKVLFVDDEQNILRALRRVLRRTAGDWAVTFVASGDDALAAIQREAFDVLVTDCMMPGMDGGQLVERVRSLRPRMVRILLTGNAPVATMLRAEGVAHRLLAKPCPPDRLRTVVDSAVIALRTLPDGPLRDLVAGTPMLPAPVATMAALVAAAGTLDDGGEPPDHVRLAELVDGDPGVESKFLKLVHAGFFGGRDGPVTGGEAVRLLGPETVAMLLRHGTAADPSIPTPLDLAAEHRHAVQVGEAAAGLAAHHGFSSERITTARVAGRLLGVGRLAAAAGNPAGWRAAADELAAPGLGAAAREAEMLGVPAARVGAALLGLWGLPAAVTAAIRGAAERQPEPGTLAELVAAADQAVRSSRDGAAGDERDAGDATSRAA